MTTPVRLLVLLVAAALAAALADRVVVAGGSGLRSEDGDTVVVTPEIRAAHMQVDPNVAQADREWIAAALGRARPEAARLLAEVDGMVTLGVLPHGTEQGALGVTRGGPDGFRIEFDFAALDADNAGDRATVVLHEFGHVVDFALIGRELNATLDVQIPHGGACGLAVGCEAPEERFADTFAKWALRGAVSEVGAGYGIPMPASIEGWGAPLGQLSLSLPR